MADIKIKREAYVKRIKELEQEERAASSEQERKKIARKRRYVENLKGGGKANRER